MMIPSDDGRISLFYNIHVCVCLYLFIFRLGVTVALLERLLCCADASACVCVWVPSENQMKVITSDQQMRIVQ